MFFFKDLLYEKIDSLYIANNLMMSFINCITNSSNVCFVIYMYGDLGSGKTFFVKGLIEGFISNVLITSPTYNICNEYFFYDFFLYHLI